MKECRRKISHGMVILVGVLVEAFYKRRSDGRGTREVASSLCLAMCFVRENFKLESLWFGSIYKDKTFSILS